VEIKIGDALTILPELEKENTKPIDLMFIDADKPNYISYFNWGLTMSRQGTIIIADNVIRAGEILNQNSVDEKVTGVQKYIKMLASNKKVTTSILQIVGSKEYDGMAISVVN